MTADKAWSSSLRFGPGANNTSLENNYETLGRFFGTIYAKGVDKYYGIFMSGVSRRPVRFTESQWKRHNIEDRAVL
jgi:hypothetical protein